MYYPVKTLRVTKLNHFIELGRPENETDELIYHLTIHTGSRNLGIKILSYWLRHISSVRVKKDQMKLRVSEIRETYKHNRPMIAKEIQKLKTDPTCAIQPSKLLETPEDLSGYLMDVFFADAYAEYNRITIIENIEKILGATEVSDRIESVHNSIDLVDRIVRKGATPARLGQRVIIPISMAFGVIIGTGLGNPDWNYSSPHGAGRKMSRGAAKRDLSMEDFRDSMEGIFTTSLTEGTLDEAPGAYKDPESVIPLIDEKTITVDYIIKPLISIKAHGYR